MFYTNNSDHITLHDTSENTPDIHGFVMIGNRSLFLEHVPMFSMENHEYQCILRVSIPEDAMQAINDQRQKKPDIPLLLANLSTDLYILPEVASGHRTSFEGEILIWETDNPQKNSRLIPHVLVTIEQVIHYRHFALQMNQPSSLSYLLFGKDDELFLSHYINKSPDFMHILQLSEQPAWLSTIQAEASILINFPNLQGKISIEQNPLAESSYEVQYEGKPSIYKIMIKKNIWWSKVEH
ncbi:hypothetical protein [Bacillus cereus]|uniref:hypothetical protein n=1 Tax=Bacillus cereus TaxID=1396 RepID=UPI0005CDE09E|nr:hypothetical protein [Bacillus cereus]